MKNWSYYFNASDGTRIHYLDAGEGKPVIFPHGYGSRADDLKEQFENMSSWFRCITFDQRGYGSTPLTENAGLRQSARDLHELIEYLKLDQVVLVGYSMGASVLFAYIREYGCEHLEKVVIGDMTPKLVNDENWKLGLYQGWFTKDDLKKELASHTAEEEEARNLFFIEQILFPHTPEEERICLMPEDDADAYAALKKKICDERGIALYTEKQTAANRYYMKSMGESDFREVLPRITVPALLVYPTPGSIYCEAVGRYVESQVPDTRFLLIEDATHGFTPEQNKIYMQAIYDFAFNKN